MPRRSAAAIAALPIIDLQTETRILAYHTGVDSVRAEAEDPMVIEQQQPRVGVREVVDEITTDFWTALQQGVI